MIDAKTFARYASDPAAFRNDLLIDVDGSVRRFGDVQDPWQREDFARLDPALMRCNGRSDADAKMRAYLERGRGHSKTTDLAIMCAWALAFAMRPLRGYAFAADRDQAALLKDAMERLVRLNPWLRRILEVQRNVVANTAAGHPGEGGMLEIYASDVASSYGILADFIITDELVHWTGDGSLWHSLISSAAKRSNCLLVVISNAGFVDSWQWQVREAARTDPAWIFSRLDGPVASWLTAERLAEQRRMLPAVAWARLWGNAWSSGGGDALTLDDIDAAFNDDLTPMTGNERGWYFVLGCDLGLTRDFASVVVLAIPDADAQPYAKIKLAHAKLWRPLPNKKVSLIEIERHILALDERFNLEFIALDPWQAELLGQRLEIDTNHVGRNQRRTFGAEPWVKMIPPTGANLREIATLAVESFQDQRFEFFNYGPLRRDLIHLRVEERSYGIRLTSPRDGEGHGDTFSAFALALLVGHGLAAKKPVVIGAFSLDDFPASPLASLHAHERWLAQQSDDPFDFIRTLRRWS